MEAQNTSSKTIDVYELVTNRIIELLEAGTIPWQKPWTNAGMPMNLLSKRSYRGINLWLLHSLNYERNLFLTWKQLKSLGGSVLQGQHGHIVVFWKAVKKQPEELGKDKQPKMVPMLRYYKVFNVEQCKDLPTKMLEPVEPVQFDSILECESLVQGMPDPPFIKHAGQQAFYHKLDDYICMPLKKSFKSSIGYYSTLFHELIHSTGAEKRLSRKTLTDMVPFGTESYAQEELIAEMGSAFLCHFTNILPNEIKNTAAYLKNWLEVLRNDKRFVVLASGQAQKAVDYILDIKEKESEEINSMETISS